MTPLLDRLARTVGGASAGNDTEDRFARDALLRRGFAGALALSTLRHLIEPQQATAATCPRGSLENCRQAAYANFRKELVNACDKAPSFAQKFECLRESHSAQRDLQRHCERRCPKPKRPPSSKPTKTAQKPPPPPPLPPNPYDDGGLCANCEAVRGGGFCCWGGQLKGGFCGCAPISDGKPLFPCSRLGCGG